MNTIPDINGETTELLMQALLAAEQTVSLLAKQSLHITTMESCTGGAVADIITSVSGSSAVLESSFITYSNNAKIALGVPAQLIEEYSVYSPETAVAMARAGLEQSVKADIGIGITGSLSRIDPANESASVLGEAYIGLVHGDFVTCKKLTMPDTHRYQAKLVITNYVLQELNAYLG